MGELAESFQTLAGRYEELIKAADKKWILSETRDRVQIAQKIAEDFAGFAIDPKDEARKVYGQMRRSSIQRKILNRLSPVLAAHQELLQSGLEEIYLKIDLEEKNRLRNQFHASDVHAAVLAYLPEALRPLFNLVIQTIVKRQPEDIFVRTDQFKCAERGSSKRFESCRVCGVGNIPSLAASGGGGTFRSAQN